MAADPDIAKLKVAILFHEADSAENTSKFD
jgi:hypothetical protein